MVRMIPPGNRLGFGSPRARPHGSIELAMSYPGFDPARKGVLFFSRGRGLGHAILDIEIARELNAIRNDLDLRFVSYASGAKAIEEAGLPLIELELPELNPITLTTVLAAKLIGWLRPALVIAHEEFPAMPAAKIFDIPAVFLTDWFIEPDRYPMHALQFADRILFLDDEGIYEEPAALRGRVHYLGRYQRAFAYTRADRARARAELGIPAAAMVVAMLPGGYSSEARAPAADLVLAAFDLLDVPSKRLIWVAGTDEALLRERTAGRQDAEGRSEGIVLGFEPQIDRIMVAADVAITKANRKTVLELESLGIPQVALCYGLNPIDEKRLEHVEGAAALPVTETTAPELTQALLAAPAASFHPDRHLHGCTVTLLTRLLGGVLDSRR